MLIENIRQALAGLMANKMRTLLTMLGIVIGIAAVICISTLANAVNQSVMKSMSDMGANNISLYLDMVDDGEGYDTIREMRDSDYITDDMLRNLMSKFKDEIEGVSLNEDMDQAQVQNGRNKATIEMIRTNSIYLKKQNLKILRGHDITREEYVGGKKVALVSDKFVEKMYRGNLDKAVGKVFEADVYGKFYSFTIVGVYRQDDSKSLFDGDMPSQVTNCYFPYLSVEENGQTGLKLNMVDLIGKSGGDMDDLASRVQDYLNETYYSDNDSYTITAMSMQSMVEETSSMINTAKLAFSAIAAISLLVGGIGVMNIMIVSITERTREIGTRKALGATNGAIRLQFITEAITICIIGGIIGVCIGVAGGMTAAKLMGFPGGPTVSSIVISVLFSAAFGTFFGFYPANKAARMNPIDALRYE